MLSRLASGRRGLTKPAISLLNGQHSINNTSSISGKNLFHTTVPVTALDKNVSAVVSKFYNEEQIELQRTVTKIVDTEMNPYADEWEKAEQWESHKLLKILGNAGLLGIHEPTEHGGLGLSYKYHAAYLEALGGCDAMGVTSALAVQTDVALPPISKLGNDRLKKEFLQPSIKGDQVACVAISEPGAGSDVSSIQTKAEKRGGDWILNGQKVWITNGIKADWGLVLANTAQGPPHKNKSLFVVPLNLPGVSRHKIHKIGLLCSDWGHIFFEDVRIPEEFCVGKPGDGFRNLMLQFQDERLSFPLYSLRTMEKALELTAEYTKERKAFGKSLLDNQVVHFRLSELITEVEALRALTYYGVELHSAGEDATNIASMVKVKCGRLLRELSDSCLQYWGAMGYSKETLISRYYRDFRAASIAGGADEVCLGIIAKRMGYFPRK